MKTAAELAALQNKLRQMLPNEGISAILAELKKVLPEHSDKFNLVFQLEARLNTTNRDRLRGILSQEQLELAYNRISADLLDFINGLEVKDFDPVQAGSAAASKMGNILYRIPHTMELTTEYRCVVRLAYEDEVVVKNIELTADTVIKPVRVSEVMEVELIDPHETPAFSIRKMNLTEQFVEKGDYTEWIFFVRPLRIGELPLVLKVTVSEIINERERKKEIVLEEVIHVVAEDTSEVEESATYKTAGYFSYSIVSDEGQRPNRRKLVTALVAVLVVATGIWATGAFLGIFPPFDKPSAEAIDRQDWAAALQPSTDSSFTVYLQKHPEGLFADLARFKIDSLQQLENTPPPDTTDTFQSIDEEIFEEESAAEEESVEHLQKKEKPQPPVVKPYQPADGRKKSGFNMIFVQGGAFTMGSKDGDKEECPHKKKVNDFYIGQYEMTQADWKEITGKRHKSFTDGCPDCPVESVSWAEVQEFIRKANAKTGNQYRLPTEVEWEYAARGGRKSKGFKYAGSDNANEVARFEEYQKGTTNVGSKKPNELAIYDMSGNVREWCNETWKPYPSCKGTASNKYVVRGGSWQTGSKNVAVYARDEGQKKGKGDSSTGFRLVQIK